MVYAGKKSLRRKHNYTLRNYLCILSKNLLRDLIHKVQQVDELLYGTYAANRNFNLNWFKSVVTIVLHGSLTLVIMDITTFLTSAKNISDLLSAAYISFMRHFDSTESLEQCKIGERVEIFVTSASNLVTLVLLIVAVLLMLGALPKHDNKWSGVHLVWWRSLTLRVLSNNWTRNSILRFSVKHESVLFLYGNLLLKNIMTGTITSLHRWNLSKLCILIWKKRI